MRRSVLIISGVLVALCLAFTLKAEVFYQPKTSCTGSLKIEIDSIDYNIEYTRVYGALVGQPHTSARIDKIDIVNSKTPIEAVDIDGVDFGRWFQWEDDGRIPVEIDFPPMSRACNIMRVQCPHSTAYWTINFGKIIRK